MSPLFSTALTAALISGAAASASSYTYTTIAVPNATSTIVEGLNKGGAVVGEYQQVGSNFPTHGFVFSDGQYQTIDPPGSIDTFIVDISDDGTIFGGFVTTSGGLALAFTYKNGGYTILGDGSVGVDFRAVSRNGLAYGDSTNYTTDKQQLFSQKNLVTRLLAVTHDFCFFSGVNDDAVSTGTCAPSSGANTRPFSFQAGTRTKIVIPFGVAIKPSGINTSGTIVGYYRDTRVSALRGFIDKAGAVTVVNDPNRRKTALYGVNDAGDVVGVGSDSQFIDSGNDPFVYSNGTFTYLQPTSAPGYAAEADKINAAGQVLGNVSSDIFTNTGFLATPVP